MKEWFDLRDMLRRVNPLGLRNDAGKLEVYTRPADCYFEMMKRLWVKYPGGFIDIPLVMYEEQKLDKKAIFSVCSLCQYVLIPTWEDCEERNKGIYMLFSFLVAPHSITIDKEALALAFFYFDAFLEKEELSAKDVRKCINNLKKV